MKSFFGGRVSYTFSFFYFFIPLDALWPKNITRHVPRLISRQFFSDVATTDDPTGKESP